MEDLGRDSTGSLENSRNAMCVPLCLSMAGVGLKVLSMVPDKGWGLLILVGYVRVLDDPREV